MLLGIDVGGTHTDAVLIDNSGIVATFKEKTDKDNLFETVKTALEKVTAGIDVKKIKNINLSTTLSTNAIIEDKTEKTGLLLSSGPGIDPGNFKLGEHTFIFDGSINHRGTEVLRPDTGSIGRSVEKCVRDGVKVFAVVTKFSTRNSSQETAAASLLEGSADFITRGHTLSSQLGFPRRAATAYYNSAVWRIYSGFIESITGALKGMGIAAPVNILKADGGTMPSETSRKLPVESILSGPAASILGIMALSRIEEDSILLDIGGTTTDIAVFASGAPLMERDGISIGGVPTLVRSLQNRSIGIGGDSAITVQDGRVKTGPERKGPSVAEGGKTPTLVDALNYKGIMKHMDSDRSANAIKNLASENGMDPAVLAEQAISYSTGKIRDEINSLLDEINRKPVYTIYEMLHGKIISPKKTYIIGGPAKAMAEVLKGDTEIIVPGNYSVANAIGSAVARTTFETELFSDTGREIMVMPNIGVRVKVGRSYSLRDAERDAVEYTKKFLNETGFRESDAGIDIVESTSFRMINGFSSSGNDIRVKCQIRPGVIMNMY